MRSMPKIECIWHRCLIQHQISHQWGRKCVVFWEANGVQVTHAFVSWLWHSKGRSQTVVTAAEGQLRLEQRHECCVVFATHGVHLDAPYLVMWKKERSSQVMGKWLLPCFRWRPLHVCYAVPMTAGIMAEEKPRTGILAFFSVFNSFQDFLLLFIEAFLLLGALVTAGKSGCGKVKEFASSSRDAVERTWSFSASSNSK